MTELGEMAAALLAIEKTAAKGRQKEHGGTAPGKAKEHSGERPQSVTGSEPQRARDKVGEALGVSGQTAERAAKVVEAAKAEPDKFGDLLVLMDNRGVAAALAVRRPECPGVAAGTRFA